jgi:hypothetical protein
MKVCANCNPISELLTDESGELYCRFHGQNYRLEEREDPLEAPAETPVEAPAEVRQ